MQFIGPLFGLLVLLVVVLFAAYLLLWSLFKPVADFVKYRMFAAINPAGFEIYFRLLHNKFPYFRLLNEEEQRNFVNRLRYVRDHKNFRSRDNNLVVTEEMEILFSASIVQLTFGFGKFDLEHFNELHLTATSFYSNLLQENVKGLTFERSGRIILSWADFEEGYRIGNDKYNLGLHELAHAFWVAHFTTPEMEEYFNQWLHAAMPELHSIRMNTDTDFFRDYAATNIEELWACSVECFFEAPVEFRNKIPDLYARVSETLNQDMAARMLARMN